jgi:hypothetical protein
VTSDQRNFVNAPILADPVHAAGALADTRRCPGQLEVHHEPAPMLEIQAFRRRIGGNQDGVADSERRDRSPALVGGHAAVQQQHAVAQL